MMENTDRNLSIKNQETVSAPARDKASVNDENLQVAYVDGIPYPIKEGETVLNFIKRNLGEDNVPTLCDAPNLKPFGSCRVCSVDMAMKQGGPVKAVASCHTPINPGAYLYPASDRIKRLRKNIVELVLTDYPQEKFEEADANWNELVKVAEAVGVSYDDIRYPEGKNHFGRSLDDSHPYMRSDLSTCINCYRCVRACEEVQGEMVLTMAKRGFDAVIQKGMGDEFNNSDCVSCGACAQACPTGAITDIYESKKNAEKDAVRTVCTYCGVGCNLNVTVRDGEVQSILAPYNAEVNEGHTCLKGRYAFKFYNHEDRLRTPLIKKDGEFVEATWDEAYDYVAQKLNTIMAENGPDAIAGISSARCTNEENYLMQKFIRAVIGTNNIDCCARVCHSPTALGMQRTFGTGAATNSIMDLKYTDCMLVIGANPTDAHPVTGARIKQAAISGKEMIIIDPRRTELARYADLHLQLRPGTNVAVLNMMMYYILSEGWEDSEFIRTRCEDFDGFRTNIMSLDMDEMERISGVPKEQARRAAEIYAKAGNAMSFHGLGVTEHSQGTFTVMQIADLAMLTGNIGRRGVGVNPLRGQNNVQGAADMGAQPHQGAGYLDVTDPEVHQKYESFYGAKLPLNIGYKIPQMFDAAIAGDLKALWLMGEDVVQTDPNTSKVKKALTSLDLLVVQELFMTETAKLADVIFPGASFLEKSGTFTNGERRIQRVNKVVEPLEGTKSDGQIVVDIMNRMGYKQPDYDPKTALEEISQIVPFFKGVKWDELGENGKQWPVKEDGSDSDMIHTDSFKRGKGKFFFKPFRESQEIEDHGEKFPYILTTNRELEHYNCGTMTRRTPNVDILTEDTIMIHPGDAADKGIKDGEMVCVISDRGKVDIKAKITDEVKPGVLSTTFHFPEIMVNLLTSDVHDSEAMCPEYKVVSVDFRRSKGLYKT